MLQDFDIYAPHLVYLRKQMLDWKPQGFWDFFIRGYSDRLSWFTAMVGLAFGLLGVVGVTATLIQGIVTSMALKAAYLTLDLQRNQSQSAGN